MGIAMNLNLEEAESFSAPEHLANHYNDGKIDYEQMAVLSAKFYQKENDTLVDELGKKNAILISLEEHLSNATTENATLSAKLTKFENQDLALAMARSEVEELKLNASYVDAHKRSAVALAAKAEELEVKLNAQSSDLAMLDKLKQQVESLTNERNELNDSLVAAASEIKRAANLAIGHETSMTELRNSLRVTKSVSERQLSDLSDVKAKLKEEKATTEELRALIRDNSDSVDEAKAAINTVAQSIITLDKNQKALDKENRHLSLYVSSHTAVPILETPQGHQLKALTLDKNQIVSNGGKESIKDNTALFQWVNPNGFSCLVALSNTTKKVKGKESPLLLMPSLVDENIAGKLTPTGKKVAKNLTESIAPPPEYYEVIARHIQDFNVEEYKKALLKSFSRATYLANATEHLTLELGDGLAQGDIDAMKEIAASHDKVLSRNIIRKKQALRPKAKAKNKSKKRR